MRDIQLLQQAFGFQAPWTVLSATFDPSQKRIDIHVGFAKGSHFTCPACGRPDCTAYDTHVKQWRHLNFFEHETHLSARVPRAACPECGPKLVEVPWARSGSGFTLFFEALIMMLAKERPVNAIARLVHAHDTRVWRVLHHYVAQARSELDLSAVDCIGIDETSRKRGHHYVSVVVDWDTPQALFATAGKGAAVVKALRADLIAHHGDPATITEVCCDMSPAFISGVETHLPQAALTFDKFHVMKVLNDAVDAVRRQEQKERPELKKSRYLWLKNPNHLKVAQQLQLHALRLSTLNLKTARAYQLRLTFQELWRQPAEHAAAFLKKWYFWATHSRLEPIKEAAYTIKRHWDGVLRWFTSQINNGILEGINSLVQAAKARARGDRSTRNFITMIYLIAGKLNFHLPT